MSFDSVETTEIPSNTPFMMTKRFNVRIVIEMIYSEVHTYLIKKIRDVIFGFDLSPRVTVPSRFLKNLNDPSPQRNVIYGRPLNNNSPFLRTFFQISIF